MALETKIKKGHLLGAFNKAVISGLVLAAAGLTGCQTAHNMYESSTQAIESGWYDVTGQGMVCERSSNRLDTRYDASKADARTNKLAGVTQRCVQPDKMKKYMKAQAELQEYQMKSQLEIQKMQQDSSIRLQKERLAAEQEAAKLRDCQKLERDLLLKNQTIDAKHLCKPILDSAPKLK